MVSGGVLDQVMDASSLPGTGERQAGKGRDGRKGKVNIRNYGKRRDEELSDIRTASIGRKETDHEGWRAGRD